MINLNDPIILEINFETYCQMKKKEEIQSLSPEEQYEAFQKAEEYYFQKCPYEPRNKNIIRMECLVQFTWS